MITALKKKNLSCQLQAIPKMTHWPNSLLLLCRHKQVPPVTLHLPALGLRFQMVPHPPTLQPHSRNKEKPRRKCVMQSNPHQRGSTSHRQAEALTQSFNLDKTGLDKSTGDASKGNSRVIVPRSNTAFVELQKQITA